MKNIISKEWLSILILPLSSVFLGVMLACAEFPVKASVIIALAFTAVILKTVSVIKRNKDDFEQERTYNIALLISELAFVASAILLVYISYGSLFCLDAFVFLLLGYFFLRTALFPAKRPAYLEAVYTISLYGPLGVISAYMLCAHTVLGWSLLLPAFSLGFLVAAAKDVFKPLYHTLMIVVAFVLMAVFGFFRIFDLYHFLFLLSLPLFIVHLVRHWREPKESPSKLLLVSILLFSLLSGLGYLLFPLFHISAF